MKNMLRDTGTKKVKVEDIEWKNKNKNYASNGFAGIYNSNHHSKCSI